MELNKINNEVFFENLAIYVQSGKVLKTCENGVEIFEVLKLDLFIDLYNHLVETKRAEKMTDEEFENYLYPLKKHCSVYFWLDTDTNTIIFES